METEKDGFPITAIREIKILKELNHKNIIKLKEIVTSKGTEGDPVKKGSIYLVFEFMDHDLAGLLDSPNLKAPNAQWFKPEHIKCYMKQLLEGLHYLHSNNVLHRDIKASNLLINNQGVLKLADFGLARPVSSKGGNYTNNVITLWYRPPELLLGANSYGPAVDMWSVGCIMAELLYKKPIFPGKTELDQLDLIFRLCGSPTEENWSEARSLVWYDKFCPTARYRSRLRDVFSNFDTKALDLISRMLALDPKKRITCSEALDSDYFWSEPMPCEPSELPKYPSSHEFTARKRKQQLPARTAPGPVGPAPPHHAQYSSHNNGHTAHQGYNNNHGPGHARHYPEDNRANKRQKVEGGQYVPVSHLPSHVTSHLAHHNNNNNSNGTAHHGNRPPAPPHNQTRPPNQPHTAHRPPQPPHAPPPNRPPPPPHHHQPRPPPPPHQPGARPPPQPHYY
jgi:cyclin-dependent kinase 12/13